jgi:hypothetical protein
MESLGWREFSASVFESKGLIFKIFWNKDLGAAVSFQPSVISKTWVPTG